MPELSFNDIPAAMSRLLDMVDAILKLLGQVDQLKTFDTKDRWFTVKEVKDYLPTHPSTSDIYTKVHNRSIPFHKPDGKRVLFLKSEIDAYLMSNPVKTKKQDIEEAENLIIKKYNQRKNHKKH